MRVFLLSVVSQNEQVQNYPPFHECLETLEGKGQNTDKCLMEPENANRTRAPMEVKTNRNAGQCGAKLWFTQMHHEGVGSPRMSTDAASIELCGDAMHDASSVNQA